MTDVSSGRIIALCKFLGAGGDIKLLEKDNRLFHILGCIERITERMRRAYPKVTYEELAIIFEMADRAALVGYPSSNLFFGKSGLRYFKMQYHGWVVTVVEPNREKQAIRVQIYIATPEGMTVAHGRVFNGKLIKYFCLNQ